METSALASASETRNTANKGINQGAGGKMSREEVRRRYLQDRRHVQKYGLQTPGQTWMGNTFSWLTTETRGLLRSYAELFSSPALRRLLCVGIAYYGGVSCILTLMPLHASQVRRACRWNGCELYMGIWHV